MTIDKLGNDLTSNKVFLIKQGLIGNGWCCAPKHMTCEQVQAAVNGQIGEYVPGTPWTVAPREHEDDTLCSPGACADCEERQHWFLIGGLTGAMLITAMEDASGFPDDLVLQGYRP